MGKDCQCHRLFYPTLISSRSSNYVNSLKAKTTTLPVITTLRTIAVMQRKKRKNEDSRYPANQLDSQPGPTPKRTQGLFEYDYRQSQQGIFSSPESHLFYMGSNRFLGGLDHEAFRHKQDKLANRTELSHASSNSNTCTNTQSDHDRRTNRCRKSDYRPCKGKENCSGARKQSFGPSNWKVRPIPTEHAPSLNPQHSPKIAVSEDRDQLLFTMSPFSVTQTLSTFMLSSAHHLENRDSSRTHSDEQAEESDDDKDERLISITSVLPIDIIPQSHKSS